MPCYESINVCFTPVSVNNTNAIFTGNSMAKNTKICVENSITAELCLREPVARQVDSYDRIVYTLTIRLFFSAIYNFSSSQWEFVSFRIRVRRFHETLPQRCCKLVSAAKHDSLT